MNGSAAARLLSEIGPLIKPVAIRGHDQYGHEVILNLGEDEVIGLVSVLASWK